jgi:selenocysteine lyase/cysteine desulfurase
MKHDGRDDPMASRRELIAAGAGLAFLGSDAEAGQAPAPDWSTLAEPGLDDAALWQRVREQYLIEDGLTYLNTGTYGPTLRPAWEAACRNLQAFGANYNRAFRELMMGEAVPRLAGRVARFVGAGADEVAFTSGTTEAMNYIANGLDLQRGDEVLTTTHEHLGGIYPWLLRERRAGIRVRQIRLRTPARDRDDIVAQFERAITPRTRVLSFSHVQYTDGALLPATDLCALARERGIISVVDGAQAIGMLDFRIRDLGCDFYAASFHKWLTSPYGCGLLYVRDDMRDRLWPTVVLTYSGWSPVDRDGRPGITDVTYAPNYPKALLKYSSNIEYYAALYHTVAIAMDFQDAIGRARIEQRIHALATRALEGLRAIAGMEIYTPDDPALRAGLVSFRAPGLDTAQLFRRLQTDHGVVIRYVRHPGMGFDTNRIAAHIFNDEAQVDRVVQMIGAARP